MQGRLNKGDKIHIKSTKKTHTIDQLGRFTPKREPDKSLGAGEVGYVIAGIKDITGAPVGDTLVSAKPPTLSSYWLYAGEASGVCGAFPGAFRGF